MSNKILIAHDALEAFLSTLFPTVTVVRNPTGMSHFGAGAFVVSLADDETPEVLRVLTGPVYDLKCVAIVTLARKASEAERRESQWNDVDVIRMALALDPTLNGAVEDARIDSSEAAELDRAKWMGGGLDLGIRLLFAAPSPAG